MNIHDPESPPPALARPSRTSQAVALTRAGLGRPYSAAGDPQAQRALCAGLDFAPPPWLRPSIEVRTGFMDGHVVTALAAGVRQVVICGAGLDDRPLRFRTAGVRFFEVDHPATQADKARRLRAMQAQDGPVLVPCDFQAEPVTSALASHGHDAALPTLFLCEGLLVYLDREAGESLLAGLAGRAPAGSALAASLATHAPGVSSAEVAAAANARRRTADAEPWRTILPRDEYLAMMAAAGWSVTAVADSPPASADVSHGRRSILVAAQPAHLVAAQPAHQR
jgi:methyltransferase (TIGR00027 family)